MSEVPAQLVQLSALRALDVAKNRLQALPPGIGSLTSLESFVADENQLAGLPGAAGTLRLQSTSPTRHRPCLVGATYARAAQCALPRLASRAAAPLLDHARRVRADSLGALARLRVLSLHSNRIKLTPTLDVHVLDQLSVLHLGDNPLSLIPDISRLRRLKIVSLATLRFEVNADMTQWQATLAPTASLRAAMRARGADMDDALALLFSRTCGPRLRACTREGGAHIVTLCARLVRCCAATWFLQPAWSA